MIRMVILIPSSISCTKFLLLCLFCFSEGDNYRVSLMVQRACASGMRATLFAHFGQHMYPCGRIYA